VAGTTRKGGTVRRTAALRPLFVTLDRADGTVTTGARRRAADLLEELVEGRHAIVDQFERDGRIYVVGRASAPRAPRRRPITKREREVLRLLAEGLSNKEVAYELGIAEGTAACHVAKAAHKLGARSRLILARLAHIMLRELDDDER
jgi:DNA-binding NarL/FixJ family response regulator